MTAHASTFRSLHANDTLLRLPNAWDAASARLFESLGATAIATTSAICSVVLSSASTRQPTEIFSNKAPTNTPGKTIRQPYVSTAMMAIPAGKKATDT